MGRKRPPNPVEEAVSILEQKRRIAPAELVALIREINPTQRRLSPEETTERYRLKSRLQSLLLREHGSDVDVVADEQGEPGVVSLRHRYALQGDACHAPIDELDEDVRALVRFRLDTAAPPPAFGPLGGPLAGRAGIRLPGDDPTDDPTGDPETPEALLDRGRAALEQYDYDAARADFERALRVSAGATAPALALLELLVDHLAADDDALAAGDLLSEEAAAHPEVRGLLVMAAARAGRPEDAAPWRRGLAGPRGVDAWVALAEAILKEGPLAEAERCFDEARALMPHHPAVVRLGEELVRRQRTERRPLEEALLQTLDRGEHEAAATAARALLARWPDSAVAGRVLRDLEARAREQEGRAFLERAERSLGAGDTSLARELSARARAAGIDTDLLERRIVAATTAQREAREAAAAAECAAALVQGPPIDALAKYCALAAPVRERVRRGGPREMGDILLRLEELAIPEGGTRGTPPTATTALIEAALALGEAEGALGAGEAERSLALLGPHQPVLERWPRALKVRAAAERLLAARRRAAEEAALALAAAALDAGQWALAGERLHAVNRKALDAEGQARAGRLAARLTHNAERQHHEQRFGELLAAHDLLAARDEIDALLPLVGDEEQTRWTARRVELQAEIQRQFHVEDLVLEPSQAAALGAREWHLHSGEETIADGLDRSGRHVTSANSYGDHLFIETLDLTSGQIVRLTRLRPPVPLINVMAHVEVDEDSLVITSRQGALELGQRTREIRRWLPRTSFQGEKETLGSASVAPGGHLWFETLNADYEKRITVVDLRHGKVRRTIEDQVIVVPVRGLPSQVVACLDLNLEERPRLYHPSGATAEAPDFPRTPIRTLVAHPSEARLMALSGGELDTDQEFGGYMEAELRVLGPLPARPWSLAGAEIDKDYAAATSRERRLVYFLGPHTGSHTGSHTQGGRRLRAARIQAGVFEQIFDIEVPQGTVLIQDATGRHVAALAPSVATGVQGVLLGETPPAFAPAPSGDDLPPLGGDTLCTLPISDRALEKRLNSLYRFQDDARAHFLSGFMEDYGARPDAVAALVRRLQKSEWTPPVKQAFERHATHPLLLLWQAGQEAVAKRWSEVERLLGPIDLESLEGPVRRHVAHLLGIARLRGGTPLDEIRALWSRSLRHQGECQLEACLDYLDHLAEDDGAAGVDAARPSLAAVILRSIRQGDRLVAAGDLDGARLAFERATARVNELQSLARLADVYLRCTFTDTDPVGRYQKVRALARFVECEIEPSCYWANLPIPGASWDFEHIRHVHVRAREWLEADGPTRSDP